MSPVLCISAIIWSFLFRKFQQRTHKVNAVVVQEGTDVKLKTSQTSVRSFDIGKLSISPHRCRFQPCVYLCVFVCAANEKKNQATGVSHMRTSVFVAKFYRWNAENTLQPPGVCSSGCQRGRSSNQENLCDFLSLLSFLQKNHCTFTIKYHTKVSFFTFMKGCFVS